MPQEETCTEPTVPEDGGKGGAAALKANYKSQYLIGGVFKFSDLDYQKKSIVAYQSGKQKLQMMFHLSVPLTNHSYKINHQNRL